MRTTVENTIIESTTTESTAEGKSFSDDEKAGEYDAMTMRQIVMAQFVEHRMALCGFWVLVLLVLTALAAPIITVLTGNTAESQSVFNRYLPPLSHVELSLSHQNQAFETFATASDERSSLLVQQLAAKGLLTIIDQEPADNLLDFLDSRGPATIDQIASLGSTEATALLSVFEGFNKFHLLGTDELGRDVLMRLIYGSRVSMGVGILVAIASAFIGVLVGSLAGFYGGWIDSVLMRITDSMLSLPILPLMIVFAAVELDKLPLLGQFVNGQNDSITKLIVVLVLFSWMQAARLVRGSILSIREREFVLAARTLGAKDRTIITSHIIPNVAAPLLVAVTLGVGNSILWEAALSFLGLGINPPTPSWGNMLNNAQEIIHEAPQLAVMPGLLIFITVICFNFVGDGLQDAIDPKSIRR